MEPPYKRRRLSYPDEDLSERRARNDFRLKSIFESIFEKYGKDFDGIGDEIDMRTGEIIVNNGHILGMRNERDAGDVESSGEESESDYSSEDEDREYAAVYDEDQKVVPEPIGAIEAAPVSGSCHSVDDADSLMGDVVETENTTVTPRKRVEGKLIAQDTEEDELASSEFNWLSPRKVRSIAQDRWRLHELEPEPFDTKATDPVWRAPPLLKVKSMQRKPLHHAEITFDRVQDESDGEIQGTSIWALEERKPRHRQPAKFRTSLHSALALAHDSIIPAATHGGSSPAGQVRRPPWTPEEDGLLRHLKTNTNLTAREMEPYFPLRHKETIGVHWKVLLDRDQSRRRMGRSSKAERTIPPRLILATPITTGEWNEQCHQDHEIDRGLESALVTEAPLKATVLGLDNVLDGLGERIEQAFNYHHGHSSIDAQGPYMDQNHSEKDTAYPFNCSSTSVFLPQAIQPQHFDQAPYSSSIRKGFPESPRPSSRAACIHPSFVEVIDVDVDHSTQEKQDFIESVPYQPGLSKVLKLPSIGVDTAMRRSKCIERLWQSGVTAISNGNDFHLDEPTAHVVEEEPSQATKIEASPETQAWWDQAMAGTTVPSMSQEPTSNTFASQKEPSTPLPAGESARKQRPVATPSSHQIPALQLERQAIDTPTPSKRRIVQVVIPSAMPREVLERPPLAVHGKATEDCTKHSYDACQKDESLCTVDDGANSSFVLCDVRWPERTTGNDPVPTQAVQGFAHEDEESTTNVTTQILEQSSPMNSPAVVIDFVDSEDELSTPTVHLRNPVIRRTDKDKKDSPVIQVSNSQPTNKLSPHARTPGGQHEKAVSSLSGRRLSSKLPWRSPWPPKKHNTKTAKAEIADSFESISTAMLDDCSEDELSFM